MGNNKKEQFDVSDLGASLPAAAAALSAEDRAGLVNALKDKLQNLAGQHSDVLESLSPAVRKRVEVLREIQSEHDELEAKFFEERAALEAKYQKLYAPLYSKRYDIVNGVEGDAANDESAMDADDKAKEEKGVPSFWLNAMKNNEILVEEISERDEEALKYLKDIKWCRIDDPKGFKLEFFFDANPFFKNSVLTKTYHMIDDDEPILEKAIGTEIEWLPGKCLTQKILKKKPKKGSKNAKPITKTEKCDSFFNFFNPPQVPEDEDDIDEELAEELQNQMEQDYDIGRVVLSMLVVNRVSGHLSASNSRFYGYSGHGMVCPSEREREEEMSYLLPHLHSGWAVDQAILAEEERLVVIRFGHDWDETCMQMDEVLASVAETIKNFAVIYLVDITEVPDFNTMYELYDPSTVMFFFRNKHIMIDLGTGNNNKINWAMKDKQEFIDIVETVYRGARKGRGLVIAPKDYSTKYRY
ncbi:hypothetical protein E3N88_42382 [Mikania micrantha]|nr:hypothetical protein E3N88_42382 [Mikania micrantha]